MYIKSSVFVCRACQRASCDQCDIVFEEEELLSMGNDCFFEPISQNVSQKINTVHDDKIHRLDLN